MPTEIPNSNPWIKPNQIDFFTLDDFDPDLKKEIEKGVPFSEVGEFTVTLTLRRNLDAFESGQIISLRDLSSFKNSQELLDLSYLELNSYLASLDDRDLTDVYGASPWDIQVVTDYLRNNNAKVIASDPERRTIEFNIGTEDFKSTFTNGDLISAGSSYINKNLKPSDSSLYAQGELSELFSEAIIGFQISFEPTTTSSTTPNNASTTSVPDRTVFYPQELGSAYNFPELDDSSGGKGVRIGLVGSGGNQAMLNWHKSDQYKEYLIKQGINPLSPTVERTIPQSLSSEKDTDDVVEQMLDVSVLTSIAPNAQIIASKSSDYAELIYENDIDIISSSLGFSPEYSLWSKRFEELFVDALLRRITVVVAAGDQGTLNLMQNRGNKLFPFGEPMSSSTVGGSAILSVGGTSFSPKLNVSPFDSGDLRRPMVVDGIAKDLITGSIDDQNMWNDIELTPGFSYTDKSGITIDDLTFVNPRALFGNAIGSSGSWNSEDHVLNAGYQQQHLGDDMDDYARKFPDISVLAGGYLEKGTNNYYTIGMPDYDKSLDSYKFSYNGGTSAGAPLTAGLLAVIAGDMKEQNPDAKIGFINPLLYEGYASDDLRYNLFIDVPEGSNNANVFKAVDEANWEGKYITANYVDGNAQFPYIFLNGTGPGGSLDTSLSQTGYGFDDASGLGSLDGKELLNYLTEIHGSM